MKRGRKSNASKGITLVKSTYMISPLVKTNLAYLALAEGKDQSQIVEEAISELLIKRGLDPNKQPIFTLAKLNQDSQLCNT